MSGESRGDEVDEFLRASLIAVGDIEVNDGLLPDVEMPLKVREVPVLEFTHDEYFVRPIYELLGNSLRGEHARSRGFRFILFRVAKEVFGRGAPVPVAGTYEK